MGVLPVPVTCCATGLCKQAIDEVLHADGHGCSDGERRLQKPRHFCKRKPIMSNIFDCVLTVASVNAPTAKVREVSRGCRNKCAWGDLFPPQLFRAFHFCLSFSGSQLHLVNVALRESSFLWHLYFRCRRISAETGCGECGLTTASIGTRTALIARGRLRPQKKK